MCVSSSRSGKRFWQRNADNDDALFQQHSLLMFPSESIQTGGTFAGVMVRSHSSRFCSEISSLGFGQVGLTALVVLPRYVLTEVPPSVYGSTESYKYGTKTLFQIVEAMSGMTTTTARALRITGRRAVNLSRRTSQPRWSRISRTSRRSKRRSGSLTRRPELVLIKVHFQKPSWSSS